MSDYRTLRDERRRDREIEMQVRSTSGLAVLGGSNRIGIEPPQVSGFSVSSTQGSITVNWDDVAIGDLDRYEVQVSTSAAMVDPTTRFTRSPTFVVTEADPDTTYYMRVRAISKSNQAGLYSLVLNTETGLVDNSSLAVDAVATENVQDNAITVPTSAFSSGATQITAAAGWADVQTVTYTSIGTPVALIFGFKYQDVGGGGAAVIDVRILKDNSTVVQTLTSIIDTGTGGQGNPGSFCFVIADTPAAGSVTYDVQADVTDTVDFTFRSLYVLETKR